MKIKFKINKQKAVIMAVYMIAAIGAGFIVYRQYLDDESLIALAGSGDNVNGWAWNNAVGWISMNSRDCDQDSNGYIDSGQCGGDNSTKRTYDYGVNIDASTGVFSGYAWNPTVGWIDFGPASGYPSVPNTPATKNLTTGMITGWAKIESLGDDGWIRMDSMARGQWSCSLNGMKYPDPGSCNAGCFQPNMLCTFGNPNPGIDLTNNPAVSYTLSSGSNIPLSHDLNMNSFAYGSQNGTVMVKAKISRPVILSKFILKAGNVNWNPGFAMGFSNPGMFALSCGYEGSGQNVVGPMTYVSSYNNTINYNCGNANEVIVTYTNGNPYYSPGIHEIEFWGSDPNQTLCPGSRPTNSCIGRPARCTSYGDCTAVINNKDLAIDVDGNFSGWAWNGNSNGKGIGWISFNYKDCDTDGNGFFDASCGGDNATAPVKNYKVATSGRPAAPINVSAAELPASCKSIKIDWTDNSTNEDGFIAEIKGASSTCPTCWEYFCENSASAGTGSNMSCTGKTGLTPSHIDPGPNETYYFRVKAYAGGSFSDPEPAGGIGVSTTFCPAVLADVLTAEANCAGVTLHWTQQGAGADHYEVWRDKNNEGFAILQDNISQASSTYKDKNIDKDNGSRYKYYIKTQDGNVDSNQIGPVNPCPKAPKWQETKTD